MPYSMRVQKRNGEYENVSFDKVLQRIRKASRGLTVNPDILAQQVLARIIDGYMKEKNTTTEKQKAFDIGINNFSAKNLKQKYLDILEK